jgi:hypothetical protein
MRTLSILFLIIFISCNHENESVKRYTSGIPIDHVPDFNTTKEDLKYFSLHTWMHDTMYRHCGYELLIEPKDSTLDYQPKVIGAKILFSNNKYRFMLEPFDSIVTLTVIVNGQDSISKEFISPNLPPPALQKESIGDSILLSLKQTDSRLERILPKDCRYGFNKDEEFSETLMAQKEEAKSSELPVVRLNYMNKLYPVEIRK